ncbi:sugar ABC transporter substrate-binding protein [Capsulimonas corticalis]|uniref:Sugar ABC transporter substrate-binding protein n=1 Tax=Capsulimonas corticalis TaxID=2219043 RepID=A0A402D3L5_9BACT|nr:substrate-binding domain-containing protein [Capsulimonas corticalis]BDI31842.1 sugar ABC transporter substrate-binding protein [Capsulimonas corticalis]
MLNNSHFMTGRSRSLICSRTAAIVCAFSVSASLLTGCGGKKDAATGTGSTPGAAAPAGPEIDIAVIPKGTTHDYWKSLHAGAAKAEQEAKAAGKNVHIIWKGPVREDDRNAQTDVVQTFTTQKVSAMVLAPLDSEALARPVEAAEDAGIPVVIIDSSLNSKKIASYVATDNEKGGALAGTQMIKLLGGKGRILVLRYGIGSASTEQREKGFLDTIKTAPGITVVSSDQYAGPTVDTAYKSAQNVLGRYGKQIDGVFTPNESSTLGMRLALKDINELGKLKFVGFDSSGPLIDALKANEIQALVVQNPFQMGYMGVNTALDAIAKKQVPATIDTGVTLVTPENVGDPKVNELINPPIDKYLGAS